MKEVMNIGANARRYLQLPGDARQAQQQTMSPVTFSVVMKMSGMASTAIRSPIPSAGIPIVTTNGEMTSNHPCGNPLGTSPPRASSLAWRV
jgi:hypothetical protein